MTAIPAKTTPQNHVVKVLGLGVGYLVRSWQAGNTQQAIDQISQTLRQNIGQERQLTE